MTSELLTSLNLS